MTPAPKPNLDALGIVWMVWSGFLAVIGLAVALFAAGFGGLITTLPDSNTGEPAPWWAGVLFGGVGLAVAGAFLVLGAIGVAAGNGVRRGRKWALIVALVLAFFNLSNAPLGTALAIWTFVVVIPALKDA